MTQEEVVVKISADASEFHEAIAEALIDVATFKAALQDIQKEIKKTIERRFILREFAAMREEMCDE